MKLSTSSMFIGLLAEDAENDVEVNGFVVALAGFV